MISFFALHKKILAVVGRQKCNSQCCNQENILFPSRPHFGCVILKLNIQQCFAALWNINVVFWRCNLDPGICIASPVALQTFLSSSSKRNEGKDINVKDHLFSIPVVIFQLSKPESQSIHTCKNLNEFLDLSERSKVKHTFQRSQFFIRARMNSRNYGSGRKFSQNASIAPVFTRAPWVL